MIDRFWEMLSKFCPGSFGVLFCSLSVMCRTLMYIRYYVLCLAADTHLKLLDRAGSGAQFLTGGVFECDIAHRQ